MNLFKNPKAFEEKLIKTYKKHNSLVIGVDFDDTIRDTETGEIISPVVSLIKELVKLHCVICIYTAREDYALVEALEFCRGVGIYPLYINESPIITGTRKPLFNVLLDDRCSLVETHALMLRVIEKLKE